MPETTEITNLLYSKRFQILRGFSCNEETSKISSLCMMSVLSQKWYPKGYSMFIHISRKLKVEQKH